MAITEKIANFIVKLSYSDLPRNVIKKAKLHVLDYIGVAIDGSRSTIGKYVVKTLEKLGGVQEATIICGKKVPSLNAAFVNSILGHINDFDDGHRFAYGHPGVVVIPPCLALAEREQASGKDVIVATVAGYEVFAKLGQALNPSHLNRGFHTTGTCGVFAAAAASAKILGLDRKKIINALGIAGTQAAGLMEVFHGESMVKPLQPGRASQSGVLAVLLSEIPAPDTIIEGQFGFARAYSDSYDLNVFNKNLGANFEILRCYFKLYSCCRHIHPTIDAVMYLVRKYEVTPEDIERIIVRTYSTAAELTGFDYKPKTISTAKFSLPFCVATSIIKGNLDPSVFTEENINDPYILSLAKRVRVEVDKELDSQVPLKRGSVVKIYKKDGTVLEHRVENPAGEPENPVSDKVLLDKFMRNTSNILSEEGAKKVASLVMSLEEISDISELMKLLSSYG